jgi:hypothetical protein
MSRSASLVIAYLMHRERMTLWDAYWLCRHRRSVTLPNAAFRQQLMTLELQLNRGKPCTIDPDASTWPMIYSSSPPSASMISSSVAKKPSTPSSNSNTNGRERRRK